MLGERLSAVAQQDALPVFYHYFDLCNEQAYLHARKRVRNTTWIEWRERITQNLQLIAFDAAWAHVASRAAPNMFTELRSLCPPRLQNVQLVDS